MHTTARTEAGIPPAHGAPATIQRWLTEGLRTAVLLPPRWHGLHATPAGVAALMVGTTLLSILLQRLYIEGAARFAWQAIASGWLLVALMAWACYAARPTPPGADVRPDAPGAVQLFCLLTLQLSAIGAMAWLLWRLFGTDVQDGWEAWGLWLVPMLWMLLAPWAVLWRCTTRRPARRAASCTALVLATLHAVWLPPQWFWTPDRSDERAQGPAYLQLTQEVMEEQPRVLARRLAELQPQRPGVIDVYAIGFAPYAHEDVFRRESAMVMDVMAQRFDAQGRTVQLVNHAETAAEWAWATPLNLRRTIEHVARQMDRDEDMLFLHLTSHGARDGELAATFWPLSVAGVTPQDLRLWLDDAGVRHRIVSVSACYSGSWLPALSGDDTLVLTASDADTTSYGCGRLSELTFFGRALYDEQLRRETRSFELAHAAAREVIRRREQEAGKPDGYSNPQISLGDGMRARLSRLEQRLDALAD